MKTKVIDVADYILSKLGELSAMKLQKLVYYCQAWHMVWEDKPLFNEEIEAWANGPVIPKLYALHRGIFSLTPAFFNGDINKISVESKRVIDQVLKFYSPKTPQWLSDLTHMEDPWKLARVGVPDGEPSDKVITKASIAEYYGSL